MRITRIGAEVLGGALLLVSTVALPSTIASADDGDAAQAAAADVAIEQVAGDTVSAGQAGIGIPNDPAAGITADLDGLGVTIGLPGADSADDAVVMASGTTVYTDAAPSTTIAAQALSDGSVRALVVIEGPEAPSQYAFPVELPDGAWLDLQDDGSVNVVMDGIPVTHFETPWATDATGAAVPTAFTVQGNTLIQTVSHSTNYPIVADPHYTHGYVSATVYYNKASTKTIASGGWGVTGATGVCAAAGTALGGPWGAVAAGASCLVVGGSIVYNAGVATNSRPSKCLKIKFYLTGNASPGTYGGSEGDGYCK